MHSNVLVRLVCTKQAQLFHIASNYFSFKDLSNVYETINYHQKLCKRASNQH